MTEHIEEICGCQKRKKMEDKINEPESDISKLQIHASDIQEAESMRVKQEVITSSVMSSTIHPTACSACPECGQQSLLVYALGTLGYDFGSEARRDAFVQSMEGDWPNPDDPAQLLTHLKKNPEYAESLIWTLEIESTPVYAIRPMGSFSSITYKRLCKFLEEQKTEGVERVSIPGVIAGKAKLLSGQIVPVIIPELRGMCSWSTGDLVKSAVSAVIGPVPASNDKEALKVYSEMKSQVETSVRNFSERVYYELMNLGRTSQERAMNFAGTNAFQPASVFWQAASEKLMLDNIETERSPVCRPDSDCWDVKLTFFDPANRLTVARKVYRFTVDVTDVVPVTVGKVRSWSVY